MSEPTQGHNRMEIIRQVVRDLDQIDSEMAELSARRKEIKNTRIKGDLQMKISDFNVLRRFYQLEGDDRDELFDTLREGFLALGIGEQHAFLPPEKTESKVYSAAECHQLGFQAGKAGLPIHEVPEGIKGKKKLIKAWDTGFQEGYDEAQKAKPEGNGDGHDRPDAQAEAEAKAEADDEADFPESLRRVE